MSEGGFVTDANGVPQNNVLTRNPRTQAYADHFRVALDCFFAVWFVVGNAFSRNRTRAAGRRPNILLLAIIISFAKAVRGVDVVWEHNVVTEEQEELLATFHGHLANNELPMKIAEHDVMAPQRDYDEKKVVPPTRWIKPTLKGKGDDSTTLWFCDDDLYYLAFTNKSDHLHTVKGYDALFTEPFYPLSFGETYRELLGDKTHDGKEILPHRLLVNVPLGKASLLDAVRVLSSYNPSTPMHEVKLAMAKILIMIPESLRFHAVRNEYILQWHTEESHLTQPVTDYLRKWAVISKALMKWERNGRRGWLLSKEAGYLLENEINSAEEALGVVDLLLRIREETYI